jgi:hypothetical protein
MATAAASALETPRKTPWRAQDARTALRRQRTTGASCRIIECLRVCMAATGGEAIEFRWGKQFFDKRARRR